MCTYAIILVVSINHLISLYSHAIPPFFSGSFSLCCSHPTASSPEPSFIIDNSVVQLKKHKIKMRPLPSSPTALAKNQSLSYPAAAAATSTCGLDQDTCKWKPYSNSSDAFEANATLILIVLFCALTCALALNTAIRCFLRDNNNYDQQRRTPSPSPQNQHQQQRNNNKPSAEAAAAPTLVVYSAGIKLTGAEAECVICLSEFVEGDVIQVLESVVCRLTMRLSLGSAPEIKMLSMCS